MNNRGHNTTSTGPLESRPNENNWKKGIERDPITGKPIKKVTGIEKMFGKLASAIGLGSAPGGSPSVSPSNGLRTEGKKFQGGKRRTRMNKKNKSRRRK